MKNSKVLQLQTEPILGCVLSTEEAGQDHTITETHYYPPVNAIHKSTGPLQQYCTVNDGYNCTFTADFWQL